MKQHGQRQTLVVLVELMMQGVLIFVKSAAPAVVGPNASRTQNFRSNSLCLSRWYRWMIFMLEILSLVEER